MTQTEAAESPLDIVRTGLRDLAQHRGRPCLAIIGEIDRSAVQAALGAIEGLDAPAIDMIVSGPGGDIEAAYLMARTLRRRFRIGAAYVPWLAKSAATTLCLAAEEIVLAELGELGPLDAQSPAGSALAPFKLLEQVSDAVAQGLHRNRGALQAASERHSVNQEAADVVGEIVRSALSPIEALRLAEAARALEEAEAFCERLFRRYRSEIYANSASIVHRLIHR